MPKYRFPVHSHSGSLIDDGEPVELSSDEAACAYARRIVSELLNEGPADPFTGWTISVLEGDRRVQTFPFFRPN